MIRKLMMAVPAVLLAAGLTLADKKDDGFVTISNGKDFSGWKASENKDSWSMKDGAFVAVDEPVPAVPAGDPAVPVDLARHTKPVHTLLSKTEETQSKDERKDENEDNKQTKPKQYYLA